MRQIRFLILAFIIITAAYSCIENYLPKDILENEGNYVIWGRVTNNKEYHLVKVTKTSSIEYPRNIAVTGCQVSIEDSDNNVFHSNIATIDGDYFIKIEPEYLTAGKAFRIILTTPDGIQIESAFDTLRTCPEIKDFYTQRVDKPTFNPLDTERGVQFKVDLEANDSFGRFYNWELEVTYEYRSTYPITHYYDGEINELLKPDYSLYYCWQTETIKDFFPLSTRGFSENKFLGHNLHFVNNRSQRLKYVYSVLLFQSAISEGYFNFLDQIKRNSSDQEGLFGTQPIGVQGNLYSTSDPEIKVLGFFSAESIVSQRFFFQNVMDVPFEIPFTCTPYMPLNGFAAFPPEDYPLYLAIDPDGALGIVSKSCVDCRILGGTTQKPSYWP